MDTTETYIKQCEKAEEIQKIAPVERRNWGEEEWDYEDGFSSVFYLPQEEGIALLHWDNDAGVWMIGGYHDDAKEAIWLPRQDDLQKMVDIKRFTEIVFARDELGLWLITLTGKDGVRVLAHSMEQLWLFYVMFEKYGKVWDNATEEWMKK